MPPPVSVVIAARNAEDRLARLLHRLLGQAAALPGTQVVVCDNASTDGTARAAEQAFAARPGVDSLLLSEPAPGKARALNTAIVRCSGEILAFLDDDVIPSPFWLSIIASAFSEKKRHGLGGRVLPLWEGPGPPWFTPAVAGFTPAHDRGDRELAYRLPGPLPVGANMAVRKSVVEALGPFDAGLGHVGGTPYGAEESEWFCRALASGRRVDYFPGAWVLHPMCALRSRAALRRRAFAQGRGAARMAASLRAKGISPGTLFRGASGGGQKGKSFFFWELRLILAAGFLAGAARL